jgi:hypothetical protein
MCEEYYELRHPEPSGGLKLSGGQKASWTVGAMLIRGPTTNIPTKKCPWCACWSQKEQGCNHMAYVCGAHWCGLCAEGFGEKGIYGHLNDVHGGAFGEGRLKEGEEGKQVN